MGPLLPDVPNRATQVLTVSAQVFARVVDGRVFYVGPNDYTTLLLDRVLVAHLFAISLELIAGQLIWLHIEIALERWKNNADLGVLFGTGRADGRPWASTFRLSALW